MSAWLSGVKTSNLALSFIVLVALVLIILQFRLQTHHDVHHGQHLPPQPGVAHKLHKKLAEAPHIKHAQNAEPHEGNREKFGTPRTTTVTAAVAAAAAAAAAVDIHHPHQHVRVFGHARPLDVYGATMMPVGARGVMEQIVVGQTVPGGERRRRTVYVHLPSNESTAAVGPLAAKLRMPVLVGFHDRGGSAIMLMKEMQPVVDLGGVAGVYIEAQHDGGVVGSRMADWVTRAPGAPYEHREAGGGALDDDDDDPDDPDSARDDQAFVLRVLATLRDLQARHIKGTAVNGLDFGRLAGFGAGTGGEFAMRLAKGTGVFSRLVVQGAALREAFGLPHMQAPSVAVPTLLLHGGQDKVYPYAGGRGSGDISGGGSSSNSRAAAAEKYLSVEATARFLAGSRSTPCAAAQKPVLSAVSPQLVKRTLVCPRATATIYLVSDGGHTLADDSVEGGLHTLVMQFLAAGSGGRGGAAAGTGAGVGSAAGGDDVVAAGASDQVPAAVGGRRRIRDVATGEDA